MDDIQNRRNSFYYLNTAITMLIPKRIPNHLIVAGSAWIGRVVMAFTQIVSIRILLEGLGSRQYAVFALLSGLMGWYMLADMGVGLSLQNYISERRVEEKSYDDYVAVAALIAVVLLVLTVGLLYFISPYLAPHFLKNTYFMGDAEKAQSFFLTAALFVGTAIGGIAYKVWYAQQKGYLSNIIPAVGSLIGLGGIFLVNYFEISQRLLWCLLAFIAPTTLLALASLILLAIGSYRNGGRIDLIVLKRLVKRASGFWLLAVAAVLVLQIDYIMLSQFVTANEIVIYNIVAKVSLLPAFIYSAVLMALWPVLAETITRNGWQDVTVYLKKCLTFGIAFMVVSFLLIAMLMPFMARVLSPSTQVIIPVLFIILFGVYQVIRVWTDTFSVILQSKNDLSVFLVWTPVQAFFSVAFQLALAPKYGIYGIIIGLIFSFLVTAIWVLPRRFYYHIKASKGVA